jgi:hypothetical protein
MRRTPDERMTSSVIVARAGSGAGVFAHPGLRVGRAAAFGFVPGVEAPTPVAADDVGAGSAPRRTTTIPAPTIRTASTATCAAIRPTRVRTVRVSCHRDPTGPQGSHRVPGPPWSGPGRSARGWSPMRRASGRVRGWGRRSRAVPVLVGRATTLRSCVGAWGPGRGGESPYPLTCRDRGHPRGPGSGDTVRFPAAGDADDPPIRYSAHLRGERRSPYRPGPTGTVPGPS